MVKILDSLGYRVFGKNKCTFELEETMEVSLYYPGKKFPSLSVTGKRCALSCPHCDAKYLNSMAPVTTPERLYELALELDGEANGFLLSGGCDHQGKVPLEGYHETIHRIKKETDLTVNVHVGLPDDEMVKKLAETDVDVVSYDMIGSRETIKLIYGTDVGPSSYKDMYEEMVNSGLTVVPHITVGLHRGEIKGEYRAVDSVKDTSRLVLNSLIPSDLGKRVKEKDLLSVLKYASKETEADIIMGCMRERGRVELERRAIEEGANGIVLPSKETVRWLEPVPDHRINKKERCCAIH